MALWACTSGPRMPALKIAGSWAVMALTTANARACISRWLAGKVAWSACTR